MRIPCVVVGAGAAGLVASRALVDAGVEHVVLERRSVADTWRSQRWDSFRLNTPGWMNSALGAVEPTSFSHRDQVVQMLVKQAESLPVLAETPVTAIERDRGRFVVQTGDSSIQTSTVILASGLRNVARRSPSVGQVSSRLFQIHTIDYRNAAQLPDGAVLIVGGAQSGCQIAEDLAIGGRRVYLATSRVGRYPWTYRGRELVGWFADCGYWDARPSDLAVPSDIREAFPVVASGGRSLDLRILASLGVTLLGRFADADGERVTFSGSPTANIAYADLTAARLTSMVDAYIAQQGINAPAPEDEPGADLTQDVDLVNAKSLHLSDAGISTIIWATGFTGDLSWVHLPIWDDAGEVRHDGCASPVPGLWYLGFPWLTRRRSGIFYGLPGDAQEVVQGVLRHLGADQTAGR